MKHALVGRSWVAVFCCAAVVQAGGTNVSDIDSVKIFPRVFNDDPDSILTITNNYPARVEFDDQQLDGDGIPGEFANRHVWQFSTDGGATSLPFGPTSFFDVFMDVTLEAGTTVNPRKEAGFLIDNGDCAVACSGQAQFIVNSDGHEVVVFGGGFPFFAFPPTYDVGETITLGLSYFQDPNDSKFKVIYHAGALSSPALEIDNAEHMLLAGSRVGGYGQFQLDTLNPNNGAVANFGAISIVPEPFGLVWMGLAAVGLIRRRA